MNVPRIMKSHLFSTMRTGEFPSSAMLAKLVLAENLHILTNSNKILNSLASETNRRKLGNEKISD